MATADAQRDIQLPSGWPWRRVLASAPVARKHGDALLLTSQTPAGVSTVSAAAGPSGLLSVRGWGPGASWWVARFEADLGLQDQALFSPEHPVLQRWIEQYGVPRFGATGRVMEALLPSILGQLVTTRSAGRSWRAMVRTFGEPAPGPFAELFAPPTMERLRGLSYARLHPLGVERKRAETLLRAVSRAGRLEQTSDLPPDQRRGRLEALRGIGPWTSALVAQQAWGDADAIAVGDYHLPHTVTYAFTGRHRGSDEEMLALLEPYRPHRGRVVQLLHLAQVKAPSHGARKPVRDIRRQ